MLTVIRGAGDLASGIALRLRRSRIQVVMTDMARPTAIRRTVCFSQAIVHRETVVEDVTARRAEGAAQALELLRAGVIPVLADPEGRCIPELRPDAVVDAILAKRNLGTKITDAPWSSAWARALRRGRTATPRWRPCGGTIWAG